MRILLGVGALLIILVSAAVAQDAVIGGGAPTPPPAKPTEKPKPKPKPLGPDPCLKKKCGVGQECQRKKGAPSVAECVCFKSCVNREFPDPMCTNTNKTFNSMCEFQKAVCECKKGKECKPPGPGDYIVYYAECQGEFCNKEYDMLDYANRLGQWFRDTHAARAMIPADVVPNKDDLMNVLSAKDRRISSAMYNSANGNAVYVSWWFCDLNRDKEAGLSRKEISLITRSLMPNEQCIQTFLSKCDKDSDSKITDAEWHGPSCFNVTKGRKSCADIYKLSSYI